MSAEDCDKVELPTWGQDVAHSLPPDSHLSLKPFKIASLLLAKLGDFLVPGGVATVSSRRPSDENAGGATGGACGGDKDREDMDVQDGRLSVFIHKRDDQSCHEVIQPLMSADSRPFRLGGGANMERVVKMDREMTKVRRMMMVGMTGMVAMGVIVIIIVVVLVMMIAYHITGYYCEETTDVMSFITLWILRTSRKKWW